jgi:hypothetical protein
MKGFYKTAVHCDCNKGRQDYQFCFHGFCFMMQRKRSGRPGASFFVKQQGKFGEHQKFQDYQF